MASAIRNFAGRAVWVCDADGPPIAGERDAIDLIGETYGTGAEWIAIPAGRLSGDFLRLRTGVAGAFLQKLVNYQLRVVIVGDLGRATSESRPLADFVTESNRGDRVWFAADEAELESRLAALVTGGGVRREGLSCREQGQRMRGGQKGKPHYSHGCMGIEDE